MVEAKRVSLGEGDTLVQEINWLTVLSSFSFLFIWKGVSWQRRGKGSGVR